MALVTAAEVALNLPGLTSNSAELAANGPVDVLIARADAALAQWCGYEAATEGGTGVPTLEDTTYTRFMPGIGGRDLQLPFYPLVSVTTLEYDTTEVFAGTTYVITSTDYSLLKDRGIVRLKQTASSVTNEWTVSDQEYIKAVWVAGWVTIPADMKQAAIQLVTYWYNQRGTLGKQAVSAQGFSYTPRDEQLPLAVRQLMSPYRLVRAWT